MSDLSANFSDKSIDTSGRLARGNLQFPGIAGLSIKSNISLFVLLSEIIKNSIYRC
jgi:hypothetical protein